MNYFGRMGRSIVCDICVYVIFITNKKFCKNKKINFSRNISSYTILSTAGSGWSYERAHPHSHTQISSAKRILLCVCVHREKKICVDGGRGWGLSAQHMFVNEKFHSR